METIIVTGGAFCRCANETANRNRKQFREVSIYRLLKMGSIPLGSTNEKSTLKGWIFY